MPQLKGNDEVKLEPEETERVKLDIRKRKMKE